MTVSPAARNECALKLAHYLLRSYQADPTGCTVRWGVLMDSIRWCVEFSRDLAPSTRVRVLGEIASMYHGLGCHRKVAFFKHLQASIHKEDDLQQFQMATDLYVSLLDVYTTPEVPTHGGRTGGGRTGPASTPSVGCGLAAPTGSHGGRGDHAQDRSRFCEWPMLAFCLYVWLSAIAKKSQNLVLSAYWKMRVLASPSLLALLGPVQQDEMAKRVRRIMCMYPAAAQDCSVRPRGLFHQATLVDLPPHLLPRVANKAQPGDKHGPFIFSPFMARNAAAKAVKVVHWVAGELGRVAVSLENPFAFDLEVEDAHLVVQRLSCTADPLFHPHPQSFTLQATAGGREGRAAEGRATAAGPAAGRFATAAADLRVTIAQGTAGEQGGTRIMLSGIPHTAGPLNITAISLTMMNMVFTFPLRSDGTPLAGWQPGGTLREGGGTDDAPTVLPDPAGLGAASGGLQGIPITVLPPLSSLAACVTTRLYGQALTSSELLDGEVQDATLQITNTGGTVLEKIELTSHVQSWSGLPQGRQAVISWESEALASALPLLAGQMCILPLRIAGDRDCKGGVELRLHSHGEDIVRDTAGLKAGESAIQTVQRVLSLQLGLTVKAGLRLVGFDVRDHPPGDETLSSGDETLSRASATTSAAQLESKVLLFFTIANDAENTAFAVAATIDGVPVLPFGAEVSDICADVIFVDSQSTTKFCIPFPRRTRQAETNQDADATETLAEMLVRRISIRWRTVSQPSDAGRSTSAKGCLALDGIQVTGRMARLLHRAPISCQWSLVPMAPMARAQPGDPFVPTIGTTVGGGQTGGSGWVRLLQPMETYLLSLQVCHQQRVPVNKGARRHPNP